MTLHPLPCFLERLGRADQDSRSEHMELGAELRSRSSRAAVHGAWRSVLSVSWTSLVHMFKNAVNATTKKPMFWRRAVTFFAPLFFIGLDKVLVHAAVGL